MQKILPTVLCLFFFGFSVLYAQNGRIYGKVIDNNTGEFLDRVSVSLLLEGSIVSQIITSTNGIFSFDITQTGNYQLICKRTEYDDFSYASFHVRTEDSIRKDVPLQKPPRFLRITEVGYPDKEINVLDIGAITVPEPYHVDFCNLGGVVIEFVTGRMCEWITDVTPSSGTLEPNESIRITFKINPDKFEAGKTTGKLLIITNNGNKVLNIKAIGKFPKIKTYTITTAYNDPENLFPDTYRAEIEFNSRHTFMEMGYCFSDVNKNPTINDNVVLANDLGNFDYKDYWTFGLTGKHLFPWLGGSELFDPGSVCQTYYVKAFFKYENENDSVVYSDNVAEFTLWKILCP